MKKIALVIQGMMTILLLIFLCQECVAGVVIEQVVKDRDGKASKIFLYFSMERLRTDDGESRLTTIIDFRDDRLVMIDHRSKSYVETKLSQWEKEVSKQLKRENPGIKAKAKKIVVTKTGETAILNGFRTEKIKIWADGELIEENWVTRDMDMEEIERVMDRVAQGFSKEFRVEMKEGRDIYEKLKPYGFPILIKDYTITHGLGAIDVLEVKKWEQRELKGDIFLPPGDYKRIFPQPSKK